MKKVLLGLLATTLVGAMAVVPAAAEEASESNNNETHINKKASGNINISGTLGANNEDDNAGIPEGDDDWINVVIPTNTIFYNNKDDVNKSIKSPDYTITNNSARGVNITVNGITREGESELTNLDENFDLILQPVEGSLQFDGMTLIKDGKFKTLTEQNVITLGTESDKTVGFQYGGVVNQKIDDNTKIKDLLLHLTFEALPKIAELKKKFICVKKFNI